MKNLIPIDDFASELARATRDCYRDLTKISPGEKFYGFALYTVDDLAGIVPSASTESGFDARRARVLADKEQLAWLTEHKIDIDEFIVGEYRWSIYEWEHECHGAHFFEASNLMLRAAVEDLQSKDIINGFSQLTGEVLGAFTIALDRLRDRDVFDSEASSIMLFCSKAASSDTAWVERESARLLNTPEMFGTFERERIEYIKDYGYEDRYVMSVYHELITQFC